MDDMDVWMDGVGLRAWPISMTGRPRRAEKSRAGRSIHSFMKGEALINSSWKDILYSVVIFPHWRVHAISF